MDIVLAFMMSVHQQTKIDLANNMNDIGLTFRPTHIHDIHQKPCIKKNIYFNEFLSITTTILNFYGIIH